MLRAQLTLRHYHPWVASRFLHQEWLEPCEYPPWRLQEGSSRKVTSVWIGAMDASVISAFRCSCSQHPPSPPHTHPLSRIKDLLILTTKIEQKCWSVSSKMRLQKENVLGEGKKEGWRAIETAMAHTCHDTFVQTHIQSNIKGDSSTVDLG